MRKKSGFALVQVMLFGMLVSTIVYSMTIVQNTKNHQTVSEQKAAKISPAVYEIVNYAMQQAAAGNRDDVVGSTYYSQHSPLSAEYSAALNQVGYSKDTVRVEVQ